MANIKTPDQRIRVFVSSTLKELADERKIAREAIDRLLMTPIMFELGARPHPPRELYKSYLEQSQIFIGIYWQSYGWTAADMEISGLEDEFLLSHEKPRLIYIKEPAPERQNRLKEMLTRISDSESKVSYRTFESTAELRKLIENDLALLISERFEDTSEREETAVHPRNIPAVKGQILGRETEISKLRQLISSGKERLITITGAGGAGKTSLALYLVHECKNLFKDGAVFVPLASVREPDFVASSIAEELGLFDSGKIPVRDLLLGFLSDKSILLLLDNYEQLTSDVKLIAELSERCPGVQLLVTSRTPLHIRGECLFPLAPLDLPEITSLKTDEISSYSSVQLYQKRANEVNPNIRWTEENLKATALICQRLDGLPLAIELAASRSRLLTPVRLLQRLDDSLELLTHGPRDLPERQQTLTATIEWSYNLLEESCKKLMRGLSVFNGDWNLYTAHKILLPEADENEVLLLTEKLLDHGLIYINDEQAQDGPFFSLYQTVREYAKKQQVQSGENYEHESALVEYYSNLLRETESFLWQADRDIWFIRIEREFSNIRAAFQYAVAHKLRDQAWMLVANLGQYWAYRGHMSEALGWFDQIGLSYHAQAFEKRTEGMPDTIKAKSLFTSGVVRFLTGQFKQAMADLEQSILFFEQTQDQHGLARVLAFSGVTGLSAGNPDAGKYLQRGFELSLSVPDISTTIMASTFLAEVHSNLGDYVKANEMIQIAEQSCLSISDYSVLAIVKTQLGNILISEDKLEQAKEAYQEALNLFTPGMIGSYKGWTYIGLAYCQMNEAKWEEAKLNFTQGLNLGRMMGDISVIMVALFGFAALAIHAEEPKKAARIMGACEQILQNTGYRMWKASRTFYETTEHMLSNSLDKNLKEMEIEKGRRLTPEEAIAMAMSV